MYPESLNFHLFVITWLLVAVYRNDLSDVSDNCSAAPLSGHVSNLIHEFQCGEKLVAPTFDGTAVMVGEHNGLWNINMQQTQTALFVQCYAHLLKLVPSQSVEHISECSFLWNTACFCSFFFKSAKRLATLYKLVTRHLPSVALTRQLFTERLLEDVPQLQTELINFCKSVMKDKKEWKGEICILYWGYHGIL
jgi:hypothetical protein